MPKIGDALKKAVEIKPQQDEDKSRARSSSALMNLNRRRIFQHLCMNPCSGIGQISKSLDMSRSTASWHMEHLIKSGYIEAIIYDKKRFFCPSGQISRKSMVIFSLLNQPTSMSIYRAILNEPGLDPGTLKERVNSSSSHISNILKRMLAAGLITSIKDGRHVRYFPTDRYTHIIKEDTSSQKEFLRKLIKKMSKEHLRPEVNELKGGVVIIMIKTPNQTSRIQIPFHPLESLIQTD